MLKALYSITAHCCVCGKTLGYIPYLCEDCRTQLDLRRRPAEPFLRNGIKMYALFSWQSEDDFIKRLVYQIKKGPPQFFFKSLALDMMANFPIKSKINTFLVPVPSARSCEFSHAHRLAYELRSSGLYHDILQKKTFVDQKSKNLLQRKEVRFHCISRRELRLRNIVLIDDVVASGFTARACVKALSKKTKKVELWALFDRPLTSIR